jgi:hypothetical protein
MSRGWQAMEHYEYYLNNPHERECDETEEDYDEKLHSEIVEYMNLIDGGDYIDFAYGHGREEWDAASNAIKRMAIAHYHYNEKDFLMYAKSLAEMMIKNITDYVEREKM